MLWYIVFLISGTGCFIFWYDYDKRGDRVASASNWFESWHYTDLWLDVLFFSPVRALTTVLARAAIGKKKRLGGFYTLIPHYFWSLGSLRSQCPDWCPSLVPGRSLHSESAIDVSFLGSSAVLDSTNYSSF